MRGLAEVEKRWISEGPPDQLPTCCQRPAPKFASALMSEGHLVMMIRLKFESSRGAERVGGGAGLDCGGPSPKK